MEQLAANLSYNGISGNVAFRPAKVIRRDQDSAAFEQDDNTNNDATTEKALRRTLPAARKTGNESLEPLVEKARTWMQSCFAKHAFCHKTPRFSRVYGGGASHYVVHLDDESAMPTRLLRISGDFLKLVDVKEDVGVAEYTALSHRWGPNETCTATIANVENLKTSGLRIAKLPKTFRDAVLFTNGLGFDFIWIDSLCIIQDDKSDWSAEAPRMACVYGNSVCTISALDATNNDDGLLIAETESRGGLDARAWVTQERMIPPRTLLFTQNTAIWECRQADSESGSNELVARPQELSIAAAHPKALYTYFRDFQYSNLKIVYPDFGASLVLLEEITDHAEYQDLVTFARAWWTFVSKFTPCQLTKRADKFLAMSGVANTILRALHVDNYWGLWGSKIVLEELAWYVDPDGPKSSRPLENGRLLAPTWSWACVAEGRIKNDVYFRDSDPGQHPVIDCKPWIKQPFSTSFEHELPYQAWQRIDALGLELKGNLKRATITKRRTNANVSADGDDRDHKDDAYDFEVKIDPGGHWSDHERYRFMPDDDAEFPVDVPMSLFTVHLFDHPPKSEKRPTSTSEEHINIFLVLQQLEVVEGREGNVDPDEGPAVWFEYECHLPDYPTHRGQAAWPVKYNPAEAENEEFINRRTFHRLGLLEGRFTKDEMRPYWDISSEREWKYFRLM